MTVFSGYIDGVGAFDIRPLDLGSLTVPPRTPMGGQIPGIPIFVQAREHKAAGELAYLIPERVDFPGVDLRLLQGEAQVLPGLRVVPTPGHTPGHQSLVVEDRGGPVVLAGQAAYTVAEFVDPEREPARGLKTAYDQHEFLKSLTHLRALKPQRVYFSHDERVWEPPS